jgi:putative holliday junction resolvase
VRILAIDPGTKFIGLAISDPTGTVANPLLKIPHRSYKEDAISITENAKKNQVDQILIGKSVDEDGIPTFAGRISLRLANAIKSETEIPILFWDEAFSTQDARAARILMKTSKERRSGHLDSLAAVVLLQSYLDRYE